jgi:hypothetical protein
MLLGFTLAAGGWRGLSAEIQTGLQHRSMSYVTELFYITVFPRITLDEHYCVRV